MVMAPKMQPRFLQSAILKNISDSEKSQKVQFPTGADASSDGYSPNNRII
jgi:hypothetical protein